MNHSDFIPRQYLPTFNSITIEHYIHKIPGLSERYIYFNDDVMVNHPMRKRDFFKKGKPVVNFKTGQLRGHFGEINDLPYNHPILLKYTSNVARELFDVDFDVMQYHTPSPCYIPWENELETILRENGYWNPTKFRSNKNIAVNNFLRNYFYKLKGATPIFWGEGYIEFKRYPCFVPEDKDKEKKFFCVNEILLRCRKSYFNFMNKRFPIKSSYEV